MTTPVSEPNIPPSNHRHIMKFFVLCIVTLVSIEFITVNTVPNESRTILNFRHKLFAKGMWMYDKKKTLPWVPLQLIEFHPPSTNSKKLFPDVEAGGRFRPSECVSRHRVAIVIPYRNREEQLRNLLYNLHSLLARQQLDYGIYVSTRFNRAMLLNIGYSEAIKIYDYQCFIFHDVDLIPQDDRLLYNCPTQPRHMSAAVDKFKYKLPYPEIFGGVSALTKDQFVKVNGFSNIFFGWGGEDDDMYKRIKHNGYDVKRYPMNIARYRMIKHSRDKGNEPIPQRMNNLKNAAKRSEYEGLSTLKYKILHLEQKKLYTWIHVAINETEIMADLRNKTEMNTKRFGTAFRGESFVR
ncbi:hypothetical protein ScPMuIL_006790 [Solemya velum]